MRVVWNDGRRGLGYVSVCANWQAHFNWYEVCFHNDQLQQGFEHRTTQLVVRVRTGKTEVPSSYNLLTLPTRRGVSKYPKSSLSKQWV